MHNPLAKKSPRPLPTHLGVIGSGTIGPDIGYGLLTTIPGVTLHLVDIAPQALERAVERLKGYAARDASKGRMSADEAAALEKRIVTSTDIASLAPCDWVLEAATENLELKKKLFSQLERTVRPDALITSNTSSLPASRLFSHLEHPARTTVTHFFAPAHKNPAVEVVRWAKSSEATVDALTHLLCQTGKVPFVTADALCFMLDRVFDNWCNEAALLLDRATAAEIDTVAGDYVQAGPFFVLNLAHGNPIIVETNTLQMEEGACYRPAEIFKSVETWKTAAPGKPAKVADQTAAAVRDRLLGALFSQTVDIVDRAIGSPSDLNLGCQLALGFKEGPLDVMDRLGAQETSRIFKAFSEQRSGMPTPKQGLDAYQDFQRHVLVDDLEGGVKLLTLRRPQAMNALDDRATDELLSVITRHQDDPRVTGFVITGYGGKAFCAGADIGRFPGMLGDEKASIQYARDCSRLLVHLDAMKKPVVAAINGLALGGGLELAMRCHALVSVKGASFQFPEVGLGIAPGIGGMVVPYRRWPKAATELHGMLQQSNKLSAARAHELGIVDALAATADELIALAAKRVRELSGKVPRIPDAPVTLPPLPGEAKTAKGEPLSRQVVGIIGKAIADAAAAPSLSAALEIGYRAFGATACTDAAREGVGAFLARRKPDFSKTA